MKVLPPREDTSRRNIIEKEECISKGNNLCPVEKNWSSSQNYKDEDQWTDAENRDSILTVQDLKSCSCIDIREGNLDDVCQEKTSEDFQEEKQNYNAIRIGSTKFFQNLRDEKDFIDIQTAKSKDVEISESNESSQQKEILKETEEKVIKRLFETNDDETWKILYTKFKTTLQNKVFRPFEVPVPSASILKYLIEAEDVVHTCYQRRIDFSFPLPSSEVHVDYKHHRLEMREEGSKFIEYESKGDSRNLLEGKSIAYFKRHRRIYDDLTDLSLYDYEMGVFLVLHPEMFSKHGWGIADIKQRANRCEELLMKEYYSFSSLNCESVVSYILKADGYSLQLDELSWKMWMFCDLLDHLCYYKWLLFVLFCTIAMSPLRSIITQVMLLLHFCIDEGENKRLHLKQEKYFRRQSFKYIGTFGLRISLYVMNYGFVTLVLSHLLLPILLGFVFNIVTTHKNTE